VKNVKLNSWDGRLRPGGFEGSCQPLVAVNSGNFNVCSFSPQNEDLKSDLDTVRGLGIPVLILKIVNALCIGYCLKSFHCQAINHFRFLKTNFNETCQPG
jgi:hypothetical protein